MRTRLIGITLFLYLLGAALPAQTVGTLCWNAADGSMRCNSTKGVVYVPNYTAQAAQQFAGALRQILEARRAAKAAQQMQEQEVAREQATAQLFAERAKEVLAYVVTSNRIEGPVGKKFLSDCQSSLEALYRVNPMAPQSEMVETILPHFRRMQDAFGAFVQRYLPPYEDELRAVGAPLSVERRQALARELGAAIQSLYMHHPEAAADEFKQTVEPILSKYRTGG